jgi:hypothetical protein
MSNYKIEISIGLVFKSVGYIVINGIYAFQIDKYTNNSYRTRYYKEGKLHRGYGPAIVIKFSKYSYEKEYYKEGKYHREDGPAVIRKNVDDSYNKKYYINGKKIEIPENLSKKEIKIYLRSLVNI